MHPPRGVPAETYVCTPHQKLYARFEPLGHHTGDLVGNGLHVNDFILEDKLVLLEFTKIQAVIEDPLNMRAAVEDVLDELFVFVGW